MQENKLTKEYLKEFYEALAMRLGKSSNGVYNNFLHNKLLKNLSEKYNLKFDNSVGVGGGSSSNNENENRPKLNNGHNDKNIKIDNLRELNTFKSNIEKFEEYYRNKEKDITTLKNYDITNKFIEANFKEFRKSFEKTRETYKQSLKKIDKYFEKQETLLKEKIEDIKNSSDGRKTKFLNLYENKLKNLDFEKSLKKEEFTQKREKIEIKRLEKLKTNISNTFENVYGLNIFKTNDDNQLNIIKNHIKKEDSKYVVEGYVRLAQLSKQDVIKMQVDTLRDDDVRFAQVNLTKNVLEEWRSNNPNEIEYPNKLIGKLKKSLIDGYFSGVKDKTIVEEIKKDFELNKLIDERINIGIKEFQKEDILSNLKRELKEVKKENRELKQEQKIEVVIEKDNKVIEKFEVSKNEKIEVSEKTQKALEAQKEIQKQVEEAKRNKELEKQNKEKDLKLIEAQKEIERLKQQLNQSNKSKQKQDNIKNKMLMNKKKTLVKKVVDFVKTKCTKEDLEKFNEKLNSYKKDINTIIDKVEIRLYEKQGLYTYFENGGNYLNIEKTLKTKIEDIETKIDLNNIERIDFKDDTLSINAHTLSNSQEHSRHRK